MQLLERMRTWFDSSRVEAHAEMVFRDIWQKTARAGTTRHPFHQEVLNDLDALVDTVRAAPPETLVEVDDIPVPWGELAQRHPSISRRLTPEWMRGFVVAEVARVSRVADAADYLTARSHRSHRGQLRHELTVQHRLSGLRVQLSWLDDDRIGTILAKSYSVSSIDPSRRWPHEGLQAVDQWEGLGITSRLYLHGASLEPERRWGVTSLTEQSAALRRRLHHGDPWRFAAAKDPERHPKTTCRWCIENSWPELDRTAFRLHP